MFENISAFRLFAQNASRLAMVSNKFVSFLSRLFCGVIVNHNKVQEHPRAPKSGPHPRETIPESGPGQRETTSQSAPDQKETEFKSAPHQEDTTSRAHQIKERSPSRRDHAHGTPRAEETSAALYLRARFKNSVIFLKIFQENTAHRGTEGQH